MMARPEYDSIEWRQQKLLEQRMAEIITKYVGHVGDFVLLSRMLLNEIDEHQDRMDAYEDQEER